MPRPRAGASKLLLVAGLWTAPAAGADLESAEAALDARFAGRTTVTKIDLPYRGGVVVTPDGRWDEAAYYERIQQSLELGNSPEVRILPAGRSIAVQRVEIDEDRIVVCLGGKRCGMGWAPRGAIALGKPGYRIEIDFGREVAAREATPEAVLTALARVLAIEGEQPPSEFSVAAVLGAPPPVEAVAPSAAASPAAAALTLLGVEVQPTSAAPGARVRLLALFEVSGGALPVTEERQLLLDDRPLLSQPATATQDWPAGRHTTELEIALPAAAAAGVYVYRVTLRGGGRELVKEALFRVR